MTPCSYCGKENAAEAAHCAGCGSALRTNSGANPLFGRSSDQQLAQGILDARQQGGTSYTTYLRLSRKRYLFYVICLASSLALFAVAQVWGYLWFVVGFYGALFYRDWQWVREIREVWPFSEKITDWMKVEEIARGNPPE